MGKTGEQVQFVAIEELYLRVAVSSENCDPLPSDVAHIIPYGLPEVVTTRVTNITSSEAQSGGDVVDDGGEEVTERGTCWSTSRTPSINDDKTVDGSGTGTFVSTLSGLAANTIYYVSAYATNSAGTSYGAPIQFTSGLPEDGTFTDSRDDNTYDFKTLGSQTWMVENLAYLPEVYGSSSTSSGSPRYYVYGYEGVNITTAKASSSYSTYGVLYNYEASLISCPDGWHLPDDTEWKTLESHLGMSSSDLDDSGERKTGNVGYKMKSTSGWASNGNGDNSSQFNAIPGGYLASGDFDGQTYVALFYTATSRGSSEAYGRILVYNSNGVTRGYDSQNSGSSVRCLRD